MPSLLVTGFEPFGSENINPAWEAVARLPERIGPWSLTRLRVPTVFGLAAETVLRAAETVRPDAILCVGQAGGRDAVTPEVVGINLRDARIPDNAGNQPADEPVDPDGPAAYFTTLPARAMAEAVRAAGLPCRLSYSAGTFVCNDLLYALLRRYDGTDVRVGFVHVPFLPEQAKEKAPAMSLSDMVRALTVLIGAI